MTTSPLHQRPSKSLRGLSLTGSDPIKIENLLPKIERTFLTVGTTVGKYRVIEEIDRGGMAVVYKAMQLDLDRIVALKVLPANMTINRRFVDRFLSEAHAVAKLTHPNIVNIHEVAMEDNVYFLAMDYIPGKNLFYHLYFGKPKLVEVLEIVAILADALAYAHQLRIVHRDLKLNNVIMRDNRVPVLIDFGLAKALEGDDGGTITQTGEIVGSPAYMAPERLLGHNTDARSDICSLGIMLYEMLTFKNPYLDPRSIHQTTMNVLESNPIPPRRLVPWLPVEIEAIALKAMQKEPEKRYQTMEELRDDIRRYQKGEPVLARVPSVWRRSARYLRRHWAGVVIGALVSLFAVVFGTSLYLQGKKEQPHWQLVYQEDFDQPMAAGNWAVFPAAGVAPDSAWGVRAGVLRAQGRGSSYVRLERSFTRDILIEFDVRACTTSLFNVGFFLYGDDPESGYGFHLFRNGEARSGITFPNSDVLFSDIDPVAFPASRQYHVAVRRDGPTITMSVNDVVVATIRDLLPPVGKQHQKIGFSVDGGPCEFDGLRVYRLAIPQLSSPTIVADRFWERGDIEGALEEYRGLLVDFPKSDIVNNVRLRMADCLIRLGDYAQARQILDSVSVARRTTDANMSMTLFLRGTCYRLTGDLAAAQKAFAELAHRFPEHPGNSAALAGMALQALDSLRAGSVESGLTIAQALPSAFPAHTWMCGQILVAAMDELARAGMLDRTIGMGRFIEKMYPSEEIVLAEARVRIGRAYLNKRDKGKGVDALNRCIALPPRAESVWEAWRLLAETYELDFNYPDASAIYRKIVDGCPGAVPAGRLSRIRLGELDRVGKDGASFQEVAKGTYPFALPSLIAALYTNRIGDREFTDAWEEVRPGDPLYLYYLARNASMSKRLPAARSNLAALQRRLPADSWDALRARRALEDLARW